MKYKQTIETSDSNDIPPVNMALEREADRLLRESGAINNQRGKLNDADCYTEKQFEKHIWRYEMSNYEDGLSLCAIAKIEASELVGSDADSMFGLAKLTDNQRTIIRLYWMGLRLSDIAEAMHVSRQYVHKELPLCQHKLVDAMWKYPHWGWFQVYLSEINRK